MNVSKKTEMPKYNNDFSMVEYITIYMIMFFFFLPGPLEFPYFENKSCVPYQPAKLNWAMSRSRPDHIRPKLFPSCQLHNTKCFYLYDDV